MHLLGLFDLASKLQAYTTITVGTLFALGVMSLLGLVKAIAILLYVMGSILIVDGALGIVSGIDRTWSQVRYAGPAKAMASGKIIAGSLAFMLTIVGLLI